MRRLTGKIALVTGASRSAGRGIAFVLGQEGATVYVTGRSMRRALSRPLDDELQQHDPTIERTAEMVTEQGGLGIPIECDHTVDTQVEALFARIQREQGRLDILVNNTWGGYEDMETGSSLTAPFWEQPLWRWEKMFTAGVRAHYVSTHFAAPLMLPQRQGLIVTTSFYDRGKFLNSVLYDLAKTAKNRLAYSLALELRPYTIASVALVPGTMRNEGMLYPEQLHHEYQTIASVDTSYWGPQHGRRLPGTENYLWRTESTQYIGRAVVALATDPDLMEKSGKVLLVGDLAKVYGFTDIDGRQVPPYQLLDDQVRD
ncbi:MAG TPA: SDR family NAD(P)-dependent oxidoreductase [Roseiflexaceae bacterium]|nr:SDR family NAD(P)-dependent oxidoreductase [Roseiflexaceae bacterium]